MTLPIMQSLWIGNPLSKLEQLCIQSFLDNGHEFHLYVYDDVPGIPSGTIVKNANEILSANHIFHDDHNSVASFSDWFRYAMLCEIRGGGKVYYVDMDTICIKPFDFDDEFVFGLERDEHAANGIIGGWNDVIEKMMIACEQFPKIMPWDSTKTKLRKIRRRIKFAGREGTRYGSVGGPLPFTDALRYYNLLHLGKSPEVFYPVAAPDWKSIFTSGAEQPITENTFAIQLWNSRLVADGLDKNAQFPDDSLVEKLKREHKI